MKNQIASASIQTAPPIASTLWLWVVNHDAAWWVSMFTVAYLVSQLVWGWARFLGRKQA
jgi:hypothetical protein